MTIDVTDFPWAEFNLIENRRLNIMDTIGLKRKKRSRGLHRYEVELVTVEMDPNDQGRSVKAKLSAATEDDIIFIHPDYSYTRGTEASTGIFTNNNITKGSSLIAVTASQAWQLKSGDYFQFDGYKKIYEVVYDTTLSSGMKVLQLTHKIQQAIPINTRLIVNDVVWYFISDGEIQVDTSANDNQDMQIILNVVEDI